MKQARAAYSASWGDYTGKRLSLGLGWSFGVDILEVENRKTHIKGARLVFTV